MAKTYVYLVKIYTFINSKLTELQTDVKKTTFSYIITKLLKIKNKKS
jgi:hypothetical protein